MMIKNTMDFKSVDHVEDNIQERADEMWNYKFLVHKQNFVVLSIVDGTGDSPCVIKVYGTYNTLVEANKASQKIREENDFFHVYVADTNEWMPIPPGNKIEDVIYQEERMTQIKNGYAQAQEAKAKQVRDQIKKNNVISDKLDIENGVEESKGGD